MKLFSQNLNTLRITWKLTQSELAQKFGVTSPSFGRWEAGTEPDYDTLVQIAAHFKISIDRLLTEELTPQTCPPRWGGRAYPELPEGVPPVVEDLSDQDVRELKAMIAALRKALEERLDKVESEQLTQRKQIERLGEGR